MRADPLIEAAPLIGERHGSCRAIEQADPDAGFQPRDGPTHAGGDRFNASAARTIVPASTTAISTVTPERRRAS
jgi:hypothetical protein